MAAANDITDDRPAVKPRIVCELDASAPAEELLGDAIAMCVEHAAELYVVWVLEPRLFRSAFPGSSGAIGAFGLPHVLRTAVEPEHVPRRARLQHPCRQHLAQPRHVRLDHLRSALGWLITPQLVHETADRDGLVCIQEKHRKKCTLLLRAKREGDITLPRLQRPQDPELQDAPPRGT